MLDERIVFILVGCALCCIVAALVVGVRAAEDLWTWRDLRGKRIAWTLGLIGFGFVIALGVYMLISK